MFKATPSPNNKNRSRDEIDQIHQFTAFVLDAASNAFKIENK